MKNVCLVADCNNYCVGQSLCGKHYMRFRRHGDPLLTPRFCTLNERFWRYVNKTDTCWLWTGALCVGYGHFCISQRPTKTVKAHRYAYELLIGPIPKGLVIDHLCFTKNCVNPSHLEPVTQRENQRRWVKTVTHCKNGHAFDETNTYIYKSGSKKGVRKCRACERDRMRIKRSSSPSS